ncbi:MAG: acyl-homoserine-lactone synthase [Pseudomonadota bacterium]
MRSIVFDMSDMHEHGSAFYNFLRLRKRLFVDELSWSIPTDGVVEMDQYDTPLAFYSLVEEDGKILAGARCQPILAEWGAHSSMAVDASRGLIDGIPPRLFEGLTIKPGMWEGTRLVISDDVRSMTKRTQCLALVIDGLLRTIIAYGGNALLTISPTTLQRAAKLAGLRPVQIGEPYICASDDREYGVFVSEAVRAFDRLEELGLNVDGIEIVSPRQANGGMIDRTGLLKY